MPTRVNLLLLYIAIITVTTNSFAILSIITETSQWNACPDNKLFQINPTVRDFYVGTTLSNREGIVITRAHIGHTYVTHSYLLTYFCPWTLNLHDCYCLVTP